MKKSRTLILFVIGILMVALLPACATTEKTIGAVSGKTIGATSGAAFLTGSLLKMKSPIVGSVHGYLYAVDSEIPGYGLYSYILFPIYSPRTERFLDVFFQTTSYAGNSSIDIAHLNVIYIPTRVETLYSLLKPMITEDSASLSIPIRQFATEAYDYAMARRILAQICTKPSEEVWNVCATDLSRGPYLFSYVQPASTLSPVPPPYLFLDLSRVHERAFGEFIAAYKEQIKRTDYTDRERIDNLRLRLVSIVLTAADWIGPIKGAMADILHMGKTEANPTN